MLGLLKLAHGIDRISEVCGRISVYLTVAVIAVGFYNVFVRYTGRFVGMQLSSNLWIETQKYLFSALFLLIFAYNVKHDVNVRVDFLYARWSLRRQTWVNLLGTLLLLLPFCVLGIWVSINPLAAAWRLWEMSPDPEGLPRAPLRALVPLALSLLALQGIAQVIKYAAILRGQSEVAQEVAAESEAAATTLVE